jgi:hypothetical protein
MKTILNATGLLVLLAAGSIHGQARQPIAEARCPFPTTITVGGGTVAAPVIAEFPASTQTPIVGSVWNQATANKAFGHTFQFPAMPKECCVWTKGTLTVRVKALQKGSQGGSDAGNDSINVYSGGNLVASQALWPGNTLLGTTKPVTFQLGANALATGLLSIYVQDDTAVVVGELVVEGCCLTKRCVDKTLDVSTGSNNGTAIPIGATDSEWTVLPPGGPAVQAVAINPVSSWVPAPPGTRWISSSPTASALGQYVYKFAFNLGTEFPDRKCRLSLQYAVDNNMTMQLDSSPPFASTATLPNPASHFNALHAASTQINPSIGPHVLTVNVTNTSGPTGLLISGKIVCTCKGNPAPDASNTQ